MGNVILSCESDGIEVASNNNTMIGNVIAHCGTGIRETSTGQGNIIIGNHVAFCATAEINYTADDTIIEHNKGDVT